METTFFIVEGAILIATIFVIFQSLNNMRIMKKFGIIEFKNTMETLSNEYDTMTDPRLDRPPICFKLIFLGLDKNHRPIFVDDVVFYEGDFYHVHLKSDKTIELTNRKGKHIQNFNIKLFRRCYRIGFYYDYRELMTLKNI